MNHVNNNLLAAGTVVYPQMILIKKICKLKRKISQKNMIQYMKMECYIDMKTIQNCIKSSESL